MVFWGAAPQEVLAGLRGCLAESEAMRIIAGQRRGHKFDGPKGKATRPTSDLVRESLFNILGDSIEGLLVIDLFAGTGAVGLEALSRGASHAIFVERNRENVALIYRNVATLRYEDRGRVLTADAYRWVRGFEPIDDEPTAVFLDPPYQEFEKHADKVIQLLEDLIRKLPARSILVVESRGDLDEAVLPDLERWDVRQYGGTQVAVRFLGQDADASANTEADQAPPPLDGPVG
ncbi:16S rRNA (guanine(966)-N(2))-methyltransferase RsmD [Singulisphaera sp. GP187]|uniref:16S rRNA (guanine(966)-N(2))-methyltransferase RsmD n=1 Tax=Singulisphaera sp. GP187 TaxID=1882752 RepID=UPI0021105111|nr:16S rRNA (guanine(966)-N(2))-methyltransferase RsmD [Singulisphaera sp. GP187]